MFNSCVAAHNLLIRRPDCGILKSYSIESCFTLCQTIVDGVIRAPDGTTQTLNHLHFALEVIGFSYSLPIENRSVDIITKAINIYEIWLRNCPKCAITCEQMIMKDILGHFSLLFHNLAPQSMVDAHTGLGLKVISVIHTFIVSRGKELEASTWNHCIRLLLGGGDSIFEGPVILDTNLGSNIGVEYIRLIFEIYLRSLPTVGLDLELWGLLDKFMLRWTHRLSLIKQWNAICMTLTAQILRHNKKSEGISSTLTSPSPPPLPPSSSSSSLSSLSLSTPPFQSQPPLIPNDPSMLIKILFPSQWKYPYLNPPHLPSHVLLSPRELKYGWHRLIHCLRNPNTVLHNKDSPVFLSNVSTRPQFVLSEAIFGIATLSDEILTNMYPSEDTSLYYSIRNRALLTTGPGRDTVDVTHLRLSYQRFRESNSLCVESLSHIVSMNTLLMLFGGWLFEAALRTQSIDDYDGEEARAIALGALGRLFTSKFLSCFHDNEDQKLLTPHRDRYLLAMKYALDISKISFSKKILATALLSSHRIMGTKIDGVDLLSSLCLRAIEEVIVSSRGDAPNIHKQMGNKSKFRLHSSLIPPSNGGENQGDNQFESNVASSQATTYNPAEANSSQTTRSPPQESEDELKESSQKAVVYHYGDVPIVELRRACIILAISACVRRSCRRPKPPSDELTLNDPSPSTYTGCGVSTLLKLLKSESDSTNLQFLVWTISCLPMFNSGWHDIDQKSRIEMITTTLLLLKSSEVAYDVKAVILRMLGDLPSFYETTGRNLFPIEMAITILNGLCGFISTFTNEFTATSSQGSTSTTAGSGSGSGSASSRPTGQMKSPNKPIRTARYSDNEQSPFQKRRTFILIDSAFLTIFEWISRILDYHLVINRSGQSVLNKIQEISVTFLQYLSTYFPSQSTNLLEKGLCSNAYRIIDYMLSRSGQYPMRPAGSASNECHLHDQQAYDIFEREGQFQHYLIDNEVIMSIAEINQLRLIHSQEEVKEESSTRNTSLLVITRTQYGKYAHEISSLASLETHSTYPEIQLNGQVDHIQDPFTIQNNGLLSALQVARNRGELLMNQDHQQDWLMYNGNHVSPLLSFQSVQKGLTSPFDITSSWYNPFIARLRRQEQMESSNDLSTEPTSEVVHTPKETSTESINLFIKARHFISQNRFISSSCHGQILQIANTRNFMEKLHSLDDCPTRDQLEVWIAYAKNEVTPSDDGHTQQQQQIRLSTNQTIEEYNPNYVKFLQGLGWLVDLSEHTGFNADIDPTLFTGKLLYYASPCEEIVFHQHVWELNPKSPILPVVYSRDRIFSSNTQRNLKFGLAPSVLILWNQCSQQIYPNSTLWEAYGLAPVEELIIMIDPLNESQQDGLFRVRTYTPESSFYASIPEQVDRIFGPLIDGMVVSLSHLAILIRRLIINTTRDRINHYYHFDQQSRLSVIPPLVARQRIIDHIRNENVTEQSTVSLASQLLFRK